MPRTLRLMQAIMGPATDAETARRLLDEAMLAEVDPLLHVAFSLDLDIDTVLERAAAAIGFAFFNVIPQGEGRSAPLRVERLADIHMVRVMTLDRDIAYTAPDFSALLRLDQLRENNPDMAGRICLVPGAAMRQYLAGIASSELLDAARQGLVRHWPQATASLELTLGWRLGFVSLVLALVGALLLAPYFAGALLMPLWVLVMLLPAFIRLAALLMPVRAEISEPRLEPAELPVYSVLVPLRDEADMVDQLCLGLSGMDYPGHRLDIIFVVEQRSPHTLEAVRRHLGDPRFSLVEVPHAMPLTKPKALDFALPFCRGEFVVVFDAEDRPGLGHLRQIVQQFRRAPQIHCVQARLVIANGGKGLLPALFAGEYAALFAVFLPALARWGAVMPLGGTSNHFRLASLRAVGGWDAYNVTEDADLGVRMARRGLACATSTAVTFEDAPESLRVWIGQRRRWMKGWMQTFIVHNRRPRQLFADLGWWRFLVFEIVVLGMILSPILHTGFALTAVLALLSGGLDVLRADFWLVSCLIVFCLGYGVAIFSTMVGLVRTRQVQLMAWQVLLPLYWLLAAWATLRALFDLATKPFEWIKTAHRPVSDTGGIHPDA